MIVADATMSACARMRRGTAPDETAGKRWLMRLANP
ncbi:hypothetical protein B1M_25707 [Burkholderia sp. TJI49]|nr:hypothetical protein B1M_25707 [Burkholderia sp. TJI49]